MRVVGEYRFGTVGFAFEDEGACRRFAEAYGLRRAGGEDACSFEVEALGTDGAYEVVFDGKRVAGSLDEARLYGVLDDLLDGLVKENLGAEALLLHSSSVVVGGRAVLFAGLSGYGKTTLCIEASKLLTGTLGDEYAYLDPTQGAVSFENYPFQLKEEHERGLELVTPQGNVSYACDASALGLRRVEGPAPVHVILFPRRVPWVDESRVIPIPKQQLHKVVLPSLLGKGSRAAAYHSFMHMLNEHGLKVEFLYYKDACEAAQRLNGTPLGIEG